MSHCEVPTVKGDGAFCSYFLNLKFGGKSPEKLLLLPFLHLFSTSLYVDKQEKKVSKTKTAVNVMRNAQIAMV